MVLSALAALGSYSRGGLLAIAAMCLFMWIKSGKKVALGALLCLLGPLLLAFMPERWAERMDTINTFQEDSSAQGRLNAWQMAYNLARDRFLGGGFEVSDAGHLCPLCAQSAGRARGAQHLFPGPRRTWLCRTGDLPGAGLGHLAHGRRDYPAVARQARAGLGAGPGHHVPGQHGGLCRRRRFPQPAVFRHALLSDGGADRHPHPGRAACESTARRAAAQGASKQAGSGMAGQP